MSSSSSAFRIAPTQQWKVFPGGGRYRIPFLAWFACLSIFCLWILPLGSSLWADELVTFWSACKGVIPAMTRSQFWPGQNLPYTVFIAAIMRVGGASESVLRLPSLLATLLSTWLLFRLAERFVDSEAGFLTALVFASLHEVARDAAANARPYGIALLLVIASVLQLVRFLDSGRLRNMFGFAVTTAAIAYFQPLFVIMYGVLVAYSVHVWQSERREITKKLIWAALLVAILLSPLAWNLLRQHRISSEASFSSTPDPQELVLSFMPSILAGTLFLGALGGWLGSLKPRIAVPAVTGSAKFLFAVWLVAPIAVLFVLSRTSPFKLFVPRYYLPSFAALALIVGCGMRALMPSRMRTITAISIVIGSVASYSGYHLTAPPHREDWRAAAELVRAAGISSTTPVLIRVGLVETARPDWNLDLDRDNPLLCPISKYPIPGRVILIPSHLNSNSARYIEKVTSNVLTPTEDRFVLVARDEQELVPWLRGWFAGRGFESTKLGNSQGVPVFLFRRVSYLNGLRRPDSEPRGAGSP